MPSHNQGTHRWIGQMMRSSSFVYASSWGRHSSRDGQHAALVCVDRRWVSSSSRMVKPTVAATGKGENTVKIVFYEATNQNKVEVNALIGRTVLDVAIEHNIDIEGACGGELACSTCHVVLSKRLFDQLPPKAEEEEDMLDLAWGLTDTSRLCCQLKVSELMQGEEFKVPAETNNML